MRLSLIPLLLLIVPIAEITVFVTIGSRIGLFPTLGLVLLTALLGTILLRWQGLSVLGRINGEMRAGRVPGRDLAHGAMILVAGVLLLTPGFVTDTLGFLLFVPKIRDWSWRQLRNRITIVASSAGFGDGGEPAGRRPPPRAGDKGGRVVDLDESEFAREQRDNSPWSDRSENPSRGGDSLPGGKDGL